MTTRGFKGGLPVAPSELCRYVAVLSGSELTMIATSRGQEPIRAISLNGPLSNGQRLLRWSKPPGPTCQQPDAFTPDSQRLMCATGNHISVWDVHDEDWAANIQSGDAYSIVHVDFTANHDEVIAISEYNIQATIFALSTGEQRVIKSPKFSNPTGYSFRPDTGHLAILLNLGPGDTMTIHEPESYEVINTVALPTVDAQGLKWAPNGQWIAVWDSASAGTVMAIYTADGQHFRSYQKTDDDYDLGIRMTEWSPDSTVLAVGKNDGKIELLNCTTFSLIAVLKDPMSFGSIGRDIYVEQSSGAAEVGEYVLAPKSQVFPYTYNTGNSTRAVHFISFNPTSTMAAVIDKGLPHIVWLWSIKAQPPRLLGALVQKAAVRQLLWCPILSDLLMTTSEGDIHTVHQWICGRVPRIARVPDSGEGKYAASWIRAEGCLIWYGSHGGYVLGYVTGSGNDTEFIQVYDIEDNYPPLDASDFPPT